MACMLLRMIEREIPPRVRRRAVKKYRKRPVVGNTSAGAEKRLTPADTTARCGKYLRGCGEEINPADYQKLRLEIPPRVRRREAHLVRARLIPGNTSAGAEKSGEWAQEPVEVGKYLRGCGEE